MILNYSDAYVAVRILLKYILCLVIFCLCLGFFNVETAEGPAYIRIRGWGDSLQRRVRRFFRRRRSSRGVPA